MNTDKPDAVEDPGKQWSEMYVKAWKFYCIENGEPESEDDRELAIDRVSDLASFGLQLTAEIDRLKKEVEAARRLYMAVKIFLANFGSNAEWERQNRNAKPITRKEVSAIREALEAFAALEGDSK